MADLTDLCDLSGTCLLYRDRYAPRRPPAKQHELKALGLKHLDDGKLWGSLTRALYFNMNPTADRAYCIVNSCCDLRCVNPAHLRTGVKNPPRTA